MLLLKVLEPIQNWGELLEIVRVVCMGKLLNSYGVTDKARRYSQPSPPVLMPMQCICVAT